MNSWGIEVFRNIYERISADMDKMDSECLTASINLNEEHEFVVFYVTFVDGERSANSMIIFSNVDGLYELLKKEFQASLVLANPRLAMGLLLGDITFDRQSKFKKQKRARKGVRR